MQSHHQVCTVYKICYYNSKGKQNNYQHIKKQKKKKNHHVALFLKKKIRI